MDTVVQAHTFPGLVDTGGPGRVDAEEQPPNLMLSSLSLALKRAALIELLGFPTNVRA